MGKIVLVNTHTPQFDVCELRKPTIGDLRQATRLAGGNFDGEADAETNLKVSLILIHLCAVFHGQKWAVEDIEKLDVGFFTEATAAWGINVAGTDPEKPTAGSLV